MKRTLSILLGLMMTWALTATALADPATTIEFFCVKQEVQGVMQEIIDGFEAENPDIHVQLTYAADGETVLQTRIASNDVPDVMSLYPAERTYRAFLDEAYIIDMTSFDFMQNVEQSMLDLASYNGVQIAIPYTLSLYGIHYNVDIFEELGLAVPKTMDELLEVCAKIKDAGYDAFALPFNDNATQITERVISAFDGENYKEFEAVAAGDLDIHDVKALKALADFVLAIKPYSTADAMGMNNDSAHSDFINKKAAMRFQGSWYLSTVKEADSNFRVGLFGIPSPVTGDVIIPVNIDTGFAVSAETANQDAALKFAEYLSRTDVAAQYYQVDGNINMIKGVEYDKAEYMDVYKLVMDGKMSLTQINLWQEGVNMRTALAAAVQTLYMDEDVEAFYQMCNDAILEYYE